MSYENNEILLDSIDKRNGWRLFKKTGYVFAQKVTERMEIQTLEGKEFAHPGDILCKGIGGELWPQKEEQFLSKYKPTNIFDGKWQKFVSRPDLPGVFAARVPQEFQVYTAYGIMRGKTGDYLVKNYVDQKTKHPTDIWVVDRKLFNKSYMHVMSETDVLIASRIMGNGQ